MYIYGIINERVLKLNHDQSSTDVAKRVSKAQLRIRSGTAEDTVAATVAGNASEVAQVFPGRQVAEDAYKFALVAAKERNSRFTCEPLLISNRHRSRSSVKLVGVAGRVA